MFYVAMVNNNVINHTLSDNFFNTQKSLNAYLAANLIQQETNILHLQPEFNDNSLNSKIITLNQVSVNQLLKTHKLSDLKFDQNYSQENYQKVLQQKQTHLETQIKIAQNKYIKTHPIRFSKYVDNPMYRMFALPIFMFSLISSCLDVMMIIQSISTPKLLTSNLDILGVIMAIMLLSLLSILGISIMLVANQVEHRNSKLENLKLRILKNSTKGLDSYA